MDDRWQAVVRIAKPVQKIKGTFQPQINQLGMQGCQPVKRQRGAFGE